MHIRHFTIEDNPALVEIHNSQNIDLPEQLRELGSYSDPQVLLDSLLGVGRDYRKRGIALAMQLRYISDGREHGYRLLKDCTAIQNAPMQAMFDQLGFIRDPAWQQCQKDLE